MSNLVARDFDQRELALIRDTVARGASQEEFNLFLYRCKHMGLDPLKPGEIFFIKYGNSPGTIVVGREGFRKRAAATGLHTGTKLGVIRDNNSKCIGAWCEVFRRGWEHPARVEVSLAEYNTGKAQWAKMPETMIQKIAEAAALRMAFPDELGGIYTKEEMDQAERDVAQPPAPAAQKLQPSSQLEVKIFFGSEDKGYKGLTVGQAIERDGLPKVQQYLHYWDERFKKDGKGVPESFANFRNAVFHYTQQLLIAEQDRARAEAVADELSDEDWDRVERMTDSMLMRNSGMNELNYDQE